MAEFTRVSGDVQPVFALDVNNGAVAPTASTAGTPVQPQGPKLDFFQVTCANTNATLQGVNGYVSKVVQAVQQKSIVAMYQVDAAQISFAVYPAGAYADAAAFLTVAQTANIAGVNGASSCTNVGFKLATS